MHRLLSLAAVFTLVAVGCKPARPATKPLPPTTAKSGIDWTEYTSEDGGFRVKLPGTPQRENEGGYSVCQVVLSEKGTVYTVHASTGSGLLGLVSAETRLKSYQQRTIKRDFPKGELVTTTDVRLGEVPGKEFVLTVDGYDVIRRVYATDQRMYLVTVSGKGLTPTTPHVVPFFESFTVIDAKAK